MGPNADPVIRTSLSRLFPCPGPYGVRFPSAPCIPPSAKRALDKRRRSEVCVVAAQSATKQAPVVGGVAKKALVKRINQRQDPNLDQSGQPSGSVYGPPLRGAPEPLGPSVYPTNGAVNFAVFSSSAAAVSLCLFTEYDLKQGKVSYELELDPSTNRTGDVWHVMLPNLDPTLLYGYRLDGVNQDQHAGEYGHRSNKGAVLLDPYAKAVVGRRKFGELGPDLAYGSAGVLGLTKTWPQAAGILPTSVREFDWEGDRPLNRPMQDLIIYEMHVRGFTQHPSSGVSAPGTYQGVIEKLDYLADLGITAIELLPIHEFNELEYYQLIPGSDTFRFNFWGYSTVNFFSPMARFSAAAAAGGSGQDVITEFKELVKAAHQRNIEVILDVVFNHTAEGNERGPHLSFRGLDNRVYYMLAPKGEYYNYSGCGNTFNCNHPVVRRFIVDCLRYWVLEMHVDGFRFDLASIMTRAHSTWHRAEPEQQGRPSVPKEEPLAEDPEASPEGPVVDESGIITNGAGVPTGTPLADPALVEMISEDPVLRSTKLIAEAWDCDGLNQVGAFPHYGGRWAEWCGPFRDCVKQFVKGTEGPWVGAFASAICGSPNIYASEMPGDDDWWGSNAGRRWRGGRQPIHSINFVTAHDGFTLADQVSYNEKHNEANGEGNRDGESHNLSWNCGEEGPTDKPRVQSLRNRQMRNLAAALLLSHGVPMVQMGDEYGHTKGGNNNTYCHDSPLNWFDWEAAAADSRGYARFFRYLTRLRSARPELRRSEYVDAGAVTWHGMLPNEPDWTETSRLIAYSLRSPTGGGLYIAFNTSHLPVMLQLPVEGGRVWQALMDSGKVAPYDFLVADAALSEREVAAARAAAGMWTAEHAYPLLPWSCIVLESIPEEHQPSMPHSLQAASPLSSALKPVPAADAFARAVGKAADASHSWATSDANKKGDSKTQWSNSSAEGKRAVVEAERKVLDAAIQENDRLRSKLGMSKAKQ